MTRDEARRIIIQKNLEDARNAILIQNPMTPEGQYLTVEYQTRIRICEYQLSQAFEDAIKELSNKQ